jgi:hypothetical protein
MALPKKMLATIVIALTTTVATEAAAQQKDKDPSAFVSTGENTLHYNHLELAWSKDGGSACTTGTTPIVVPVLRVADGQPFAIEFCRTDPRLFKYTVSAIKEPDGPPSTTQETTVAVRTEKNNLRSTTVAFRHSKVFRRYRVTAEAVAPMANTDSELSRRSIERRGRRPTIRRSRIPSDAPQVKEEAVDLYGVAFDILVETKPDWDLTVSGGVSFSSLTSDRFFVKTDGKGTADTNDDVATVEKDTSKGDSFRPDIIALANLRPPTRDSISPFGVAFGLGIGDNSDPRYFLGGSYTLGNKFIFTAGWTGGRVDALPTGQELGRAPVNGDNTLNSLGKRFRNGFYAGIAFTFVDRTDAFAGAFEATSTVEPDEETPEPEAEPAPKPGEKEKEGTKEQEKEKPPKQ